MAIKGITKNIALNPLAYKDLDPEENFIPSSMELWNGFISDNGNWHKRPGYSKEWDIGVATPINLLIPEGVGYAVTSTGRVFKLDATPIELTGAKLGGGNRPTFCNFDGTVIIADGGEPIKLVSDTTSKLDGSPPAFKYVDRIGPYTIGCGHDDTEFQWSASGNPENWSTGDSGFANVQKEGEDDIIRNFKVLKNRAYFFKGRTIEVWYNRGGDTPFTRVDLIERGVHASYSVLIIAGAIYFLGDDLRFYRLEGINPVPISGAMENYIHKIPFTSDCTGHLFEKEHLVKWVFGISGFTIVYDYKSGHLSEDGHWEHGQFERLPMASYMEMGNKQYIGSYNNDGLIHKWSKDSLDDNGAPIRVFRRFNVRLSGRGHKAKVNNVQFELKRGVATSSVTSPEFSWRFRFDQGDWIAGADVDMGVVGDADPFAQITGPLGIGREVEFEIFETDAVDFLLLGMNVTVKELGR